MPDLIRGGQGRDESEVRDGAAVTLLAIVGATVLLAFAGALLLAGCRLPSPRWGMERPPCGAGECGR